MRGIKMDTGIALFVYNRPRHTERVLEGLRKNNINKLYVFCDGKKGNEDSKNVEDVRQIVESVNWCEVEIIKSDYNRGLANSIIAGIEYIFQKHETVIVLEDDCIPDINFVKFMKLCFEKYRDNEKIMHISGYCPPIEIPTDYNYDAFFSYRPNSWGWGTWKRAWKYFNRSNIYITK
jgi:GT2 family glycosyltransferase